MIIQVRPRPLTDAECAVVHAVLAADFPGAAQLRTQVARARVVSRWGATSPSVDIEVPLEVPAAAIADGPVPDGPVPDGPVPVDATVIDAAGAAIGEILVWTTGGRLSGIEYGWYTDDAPTELPHPSRLRVLPGT